MALRLLIRGRVQGVFFRDWAVETAHRLDVSGWVRNRRDDSVEAHVEGDEAAVAAFAAACREGPERARVETVDAHEVADEGSAGFVRRADA